MWTNAAWPGRSIPRQTPKGRELEAYSALVRSVEGNTTFYALPTIDVAQRWAESTPDDFRFMFKFPKEVTHERKLRNCESVVSNFFSVLEPCFDKMSPVAIQLPASFGPDSLDILERFIIEQYYQYGHTMREIGEMLTLTESRVCQIHSNVMGRLKGLLAQRDGSLET